MAVSRREERRKRREAGLPELTRRERLRERTAGFGERLAEPRYLAAIFVVVIAIGGGVAYLVTRGSAGGGGHGEQAAAKMQPSEVEVTVLNGTAVPGLAATYGDKVEGKGFKLGAVTNSSSSFSESVVMFGRGHAREARRVARELGISKLQLMTGEIESAAAGANVALIVGEDNAAEPG